MKTAIILEGGAMRGIYTAGVLDVFMEYGVTADAVFGVSAGAIHGCSFVSGQQGRSIRYYSKYAGTRQFMSFHSFLTTGDIVNAQFCYHDLPDTLDPFDHDAFEASKIEFYATCSNVETGKAEYILCNSLRGEKMDYLRASTSMPFVSHIVKIDGKKLLDGGICDSIPVKAAMDMGFGRQIVVLTRPQHYRKHPSSPIPAKLRYSKYPNFIQALIARPQQYNDALDFIEQKQADGDFLVIRPSADLHIGRMEKDRARIRAQYDLGRADALACIADLQAFLTT